MTSLRNKVVFITGASSGIGLACARIFAADGARILITARRVDRLAKLADELRAAHGVSVHAFALDVRDSGAVERTIAGLPPELSAIDVLVNNAGLSRGLDKIHEGKISDWEEMIDTNIKGLLYVSRAVIPGMVKRNAGHIINIGSIAGHELYPGGNVYCGTKFAVKAISQGMRIDLVATPIRVSSVDPGMVETEFSLVRYHGDKERADKTYKGFTPLTPDDIADAVHYCATRPPHVNINDMIVMPQAQAGVLVVHRT